MKRTPEVYARFVITSGAPVLDCELASLLPTAEQRPYIGIPCVRPHNLVPNYGILYNVSIYRDVSTGLLSNRIIAFLGETHIRPAYIYAWSSAANVIRGSHQKVISSIHLGSSDRQDCRRRGVVRVGSCASANRW
jgi:hypothetical protein